MQLETQQADAYNNALTEINEKLNQNSLDIAELKLAQSQKSDEDLNKLIYTEKILNIFYYIVLIVGMDCVFIFG